MESLTLNDKHRHKYLTIDLVRIDKVQRNYGGTTGDKAMLVRVCDCEKYQAFEYGKFLDIKDKYQELTGKKWKSKIPKTSQTESLRIKNNLRLENFQD